MPSCNTYHLTWVSLSWAWGISSRLLQQIAATAPYLGRGVSPHRCLSLPSTWDSSSRPSCASTATTTWMWVDLPGRRPWPRTRGGSSRSPTLASYAWWLLLAAGPGLGREWLLPAAAPGLGLGVSPQGHLSWPWVQGGFSWPPLTSDAGCLLPAAADLGRGVAPPGCHP